MCGGNALVVCDMEGVGEGGADHQFAVDRTVPFEIFVGSMVNYFAIAVENGEFQLLDEASLRNVEVVVDTVQITGGYGVGEIQEGLASRNGDGVGSGTSIFILDFHRISARRSDGDGWGSFASAPFVLCDVVF